MTAVLRHKMDTKYQRRSLVVSHHSSRRAQTIWSYRGTTGTEATNQPKTRTCPPPPSIEGQSSTRAPPASCSASFRCASKDRVTRNSRRNSAAVQYYDGFRLASATRGGRAQASPAACNRKCIIMQCATQRPRAALPSPPDPDAVASAAVLAGWGRRAQWWSTCDRRCT